MRPGAEQLAPENAAVEAALTAWRRKAAEVLLSALAALHLLPVVLVMLGYGPPMGPLVKVVALSGYCVISAAALLRRVDYRTRLLASVGAAYLAISVLNVGLPRGPYAQVGLVTLPVFALVLIGAPMARVVVLACAAVLVLAPFIRALPGVAEALEIVPSQMAGQAWL